MVLHQVGVSDACTRMQCRPHSVSSCGCRQADAAAGSRVKVVLETDPWLTETRCVAAQAALHSAQVPFVFSCTILPVWSWLWRARRGHSKNMTAVGLAAYCWVQDLVCGLQWRGPIR